MEIPPEVAIIWNEWGVRAAILLSLLLQFLLTIFGSRRKYIARIWIKIVVWSAYIVADWIPSYALGVLASGGVAEKYHCELNNKFRAIWASFLLLHLGGSDNITAYSLEDNDLWLRDFLEFVFQVGATFYLFLNTWNNSVLSYISIPLLILGIIRYGEKIFVLRSSSTKHLKNSLLSNPDPSPEFVKIMELDIVEEIEKDSINRLIEAHFLLKRFAHLFVGLILGYGEEIVSYNILHHKSANDAFSLVAIELGFMFDMLYTKATTVYSRLGVGLRCVSFTIFVAVLVVFAVFIDTNEYDSIDVAITYTLLAGTIALELYSFIQSLFSDWTKLCMPKLRKLQPPGVCRVPICSLLINQKRWSDSMGQFNLIRICLTDISTISIGVEKLLHVDKLLDKHRNLTWKDVNVDLLELIYQHLLRKIDNSQMNLFEYDVSRRKILAYRGENVLEMYKILSLQWCTVEVEFDHSFLLWHIATDLCYYNDLQRLGDASNLDPKSKLSKFLSDYMFYLMVFCPSMMPEGFGELRYKATCVEARKFFELKHDEMLMNSEIEACRLLLESNDDQLLLVNRVGSHFSTLFYGCKIAKQLQAMESENDWSNEKKWEMISEFWVEMVAYAAMDCGWREHGQQLKKGGELLTHVCLLMAHMGFSKQYRMYGRDISLGQ